MVCIEKRPHILYGRSSAPHFRYLTCLLDRGHINCCKPMVFLIKLVQLAMLCLAVDTAIYFIFFICQIKYVRKLLLNGGDAARILTVNYVCDTLWKTKDLLFRDHAVLNDVNGNLVINVAKCVKIKQI